MQMQRLLMAMAIIFATVSPALAQVESGTPAPQFSATDTEGKPVSLSALKGKPVVLEWSNHKCPFVVKHYESGNMQKIQKAAAEQGAVWMTILSSAEGKQGYVSDEEANALTKEHDAHPAHVIRDVSGEIGRMYGAKTTPHMYVIDAEGTLVYQGAIDDKPTADQADIEGATNYVTNALDALKDGKLPEISTTQPYGCAVKY